MQSVIFILFKYVSKVGCSDQLKKLKNILLKNQRDSINNNVVILIKSNKFISLTLGFFHSIK